MMRRFLGLVALGFTLAFWTPRPLAAAMSSLDDAPDAGTQRVFSGDNFVEARQFHMRDQRVAGRESMRQSVTAWQVASGTWNGESLGGLSLVLVQNESDNGQAMPTTNCYVSHLATLAQRDALVSAFLAANSLSASEAVSWRFEPGVIRLDFHGETVVIHLGLVA